MALVTVKTNFQDPKSHLIHFCQRYCRRPVAQSEVSYITHQLAGQYQSIVILSCIKGNAFPGRISNNQKEAEMSAAEAALNAFSSLTETGLLPEVKNTLETYHVRSQPSELPVAVSDVAQGPINPKTRFTCLAYRLLGRPLTKEDLTYRTVWCGNGYQSSVHLGQLHCLGEVFGTPKQAEMSAAQHAVDTLGQEAARPHSDSPFRRLLCQDFRAGRCVKGDRCCWFHTMDLAAGSVEL